MITAVKKINTKKYFYWGLSVIAFLGVVFSAIDLSTTGAEVSKLEAQEGELSRERRELTEILLNKSSLKEIETNAQGLGFAKPTRIVYIGEQVPVANILR